MVLILNFWFGEEVLARISSLFFNVGVKSRWVVILDAKHTQLIVQNIQNAQSLFVHKMQS